MNALSNHEVSPVIIRSAPGLHAFTHFSQKLQPLKSKRISGKPPSPFRITSVSQSWIQSPQRVQSMVNCDSGKLHGGRIGIMLRSEQLCRKLRRDVSMLILHWKPIEVIVAHWWMRELIHIKELLLCELSLMD